MNQQLSLALNDKVLEADFKNGTNFLAIMVRGHNITRTMEEWHKFAVDEDKRLQDSQSPI